MRSNRVGVVAAALALLTAGKSSVAQMMAPAAVEPPIPLTACVFKAADDRDTAKLFDRFQDAATGNRFFKSIVPASSIEDAQDCDVSIKLSCGLEDGRRTGRAEVFSTRSQQPLFHAESKQGWGWGFASVLAFEVHARFANDSALVQTATARNSPAQARQEAATEAPAAPAVKASDVDAPTVRLAERPDDFAVVVGVEKYSNDLPDAQFSEHDAAAVKSQLLALGYPERNIKFLTGQRATLSALASYVEEWLPRNVKGDSRVFFYFSGHGAPSESGQAYLVPWDGNPNFLGKTAYPVKKLYAELGGLKAKQVIVALDSCFSGAGGRSVLADGARPLVTKVDASVASNSKIVLFAAASSKEITATLKDQGHGIFTYYFLKGLEGAAEDRNGVVTTRGLYDYLKPKVQDAAARQNRDQTPVLEGVTDGEIVRLR